MSTANTPTWRTPPAGGFRLPDPPPRHPDDMTSFDHLTATGNVHHLAHHLAHHLGNPETTLVAGERYVTLRPRRNLAGSHYPDLLVAFGVNPGAYRERNGYVIEEQGKPPDFVLEIASRHTSGVDVGQKREDYAALGIAEYWRFDETGRHHGVRLAGDRLGGAGWYEPVDIAELSGGALQGYSAVLGLYLRWEEGQLGWHDPATGGHIPTFASASAARQAAETQTAREQAARSAAETRTAQERAARQSAETQTTREQAARQAAEARVRELEAELQRLRNG